MITVALAIVFDRRDELIAQLFDNAVGGGARAFEFCAYSQERHRVARLDEQVVHFVNLTQSAHECGAGNFCSIPLTIYSLCGMISRFAGNQALKRLPLPGSLTISRCAWWRLSTCLTMASPRPVPPVSRERLRSTR